jgi:hypothetical protein
VSLCFIYHGEAPRRGCDGSSKMDFRERGCEDGRWIELAQSCIQWWPLVFSGVSLLGSTTRELVIGTSHEFVL